MFKTKISKKLIAIIGITSVAGTSAGLFALNQPSTSSTKNIEINHDVSTSDKGLTTPTKLNTYSGGGSQESSYSSSRIIPTYKKTPYEQKQENSELALAIFGSNGDKSAPKTGKEQDFNYFKTNSIFRSTRAFFQILNEQKTPIDWTQSMDQIDVYVGITSKDTKKVIANMGLWRFFVDSLIDKSFERIPNKYAPKTKTIKSSWMNYFLDELDLKIDHSAVSFFLLPPVKKTRTLQDFNDAWYESIKKFIGNYKIIT